MILDLRSTKYKLNYNQQTFFIEVSAATGLHTLYGTYKGNTNLQSNRPITILDSMDELETYMAEHY